MAARSPTQFHNFWGVYATPSLLPNVTGAPLQDDDLEIGDIAYVVSDISVYKCDDSTPGAAVWNVVGASGAGSYISFGPYSYTPGLTPVEETIGQFAFDGGLVGMKSPFFRGVMTPTFISAGFADLRLYDLGPSGGPFGVPRLVATLQRIVSGLMDLEQGLTVVSSSPVTNQIWNVKRVYELRVIQSYFGGNSVYVGGVSLEVV